MTAAGGQHAELESEVSRRTAPSRAVWYRSRVVGGPVNDSLRSNSATRREMFMCRSYRVRPSFESSNSMASAE